VAVDYGYFHNQPDAVDALFTARKGVMGKT
jgi:hypothetical protein